MKLGLCLEMVFEELPFAERIARAAQLGFTHAEMWHADEAVKGSPLSEAATQHAQRIGLALLLALMTLAFYVDISRLLG